MTTSVNTKSFYIVANDVIVKKIEDEYVIVPLVSGVGDLNSEIYSLNRTGSILFEALDGEKTLEEIIQMLSEKFSAPKNQILKDVKEIIHDLLEKGIVKEKK